MNVVPPAREEKILSQVHMKGAFLEKPGLLKEALKREAEWKQSVPGYDETITKGSVVTNLELSLNKLQAYRELGEWAGQFIDPNAEVEDDGSDGNMGKPIQFVEEDAGENSSTTAQKSSGSLESMNVLDDFDDDDEDSIPFANLISTNQPCVKPIPDGENESQQSISDTREDPVIVIIRHGKTEHNKLGLFTGWEDAPLAKEGIEEAKEAGKLLKAHGFEFDIVYTSWLSRAIETAWLVIDELDSLWLPIIKTWRLNERFVDNWSIIWYIHSHCLGVRMYGKLTGLSKQMVKQRHGSEQFKAWRRGYKTPPPKVESFSQHYPGNDPRYQKYLTDLRYSARESIIRSIEKGRITMHRKLPKSESLKDCMDRTIPFFTDRVVPEAIGKGKRVLISSSENAIRGLLMHLCGEWLGFRLFSCSLH